MPSGGCCRERRTGVDISAGSFGPRPYAFHAVLERRGVPIEPRAVLRLPADHAGAGGRTRPDRDAGDIDRRDARHARRLDHGGRLDARQCAADRRDCLRPQLIIRYTAEIFELLRWAGAAYLVWLGVQAWRHAGTASATIALPRDHVHFRRGLLVALSNPKTIAFFTAFLPQFIDPQLPAGTQLAVMCAVSVPLAALSDAGWAIAAGRAARSCRAAPMPSGSAASPGWR